VPESNGLSLAAKSALNSFVKESIVGSKSSCPPLDALNDVSSLVYAYIKVLFYLI
jgi:hypothetical protein